MEYRLTDFARHSQSDYALLKQRIDACAALGRSYELPNCALPDACSPDKATLGFCAIAGSYLFYIRPEVRYGGANTVLAELFRPGPRGFSDFEAMAEFLKKAGAEAAQNHGRAAPPLFLQLKAAILFVLPKKKTKRPTILWLCIFHMAAQISAIKTSPPFQGGWHTGSCLPCFDR